MTDHCGELDFNDQKFDHSFRLKKRLFQCDDQDLIFSVFAKVERGVEGSVIDPIVAELNRNFKETLEELDAFSGTTAEDLVSLTLMKFKT